MATNCPKCDAPDGAHLHDCPDYKKPKRVAVTTVPTRPPQPKPPAKSKSLVAIQANEYFALDIVRDFSEIPYHEKLSILQHTPKTFIEHRKIGDLTVPYLPSEYTAKCLNFIFNFNVSTEIISSEFRQARIKTMKGEKECWEAEVMMKFTFTKEDGRTLTKTVYSGHRAFPSPATTRADAMKSAISKAYSVVARQFGIGSNLVKEEKKVWKDYDNPRDDGAQKKEAPPAPSKKSW